MILGKINDKGKVHLFAIELDRMHANKYMIDTLRSYCGRDIDISLTRDGHAYEVTCIACVNSALVWNRNIHKTYDVDTISERRSQC